MNRKSLLIGLLLFFAFIVIFDFFRLGGSSYKIIHDFLYITPSILAVIGANYAIVKYGPYNANSRPLTYLALGLLAWALGETAWTVLEFGLGLDPFPSVADFLYLIGYPLLFFGLYLKIRDSNASLHIRNAVFVIPTIVLLSIVTAYFGVYLAIDPSMTLTENVVSIFYGIGSLILAVLTIPVLVMTFEYKGGKLFYAWFFILFGMIFTWIADISFAVFLEEYSNGEGAVFLIDNTWSLAYLFFTYGFFSIGFAIADAQKKVLKKLDKKS